MYILKIWKAQLKCNNEILLLYLIEVLRISFNYILDALSTDDFKVNEFHSSNNQDEKLIRFFVSSCNFNHWIFFSVFFQIHTLDDHNFGYYLHLQIMQVRRKYCLWMHLEFSRKYWVCVWRMLIIIFTCHILFFFNILILFWFVTII